MTDYQPVRAQLVALLDELQHRLNRITQNIRHTDSPLEHDFAEQATQNENNEVMDYLGNSARTEISQIHHAIARIDTGEYGICLRCAEAISPARLAALPFTELCIDCADKAEH